MSSTTLDAAGNATRARTLATVLLAGISGITDAVGLVALGGTFTSVMTGNLIFVGVGAARGDGHLASRAIVAIACFIAGCVVGARLAGTKQAGDPVWPPAVTRALIAELGVVVVASVIWFAVDSRPSGSEQIVLLALFAVALGIQSAAVQRYGVAGLSTTYMTGTLTTLVVQLSRGEHPRTVRSSAQLLVALVAGAVVGAVAADHTPYLVPVVQLVALLLVLALARVARVRPPAG